MNFFFEIREMFFTYEHLRISKKDMSNVHGRRVNSPFNKEQEIWIILEFGLVRNITTVRRNFRKELKITNVKLIPS